MSATIESMYIYPVKGCRGIALGQATLAETGLQSDDVGDREWLVVDENLRFLSQRELPTMALIETRLAHEMLSLKAPGMLRLDVPLASEGDVISVKVWNDQIAAVTQGDLADRWFSQYLGRPCRFVRFDPEHRRLSSLKYTNGEVAPFKFADAFAFLVVSSAALAELNGRLLAKGEPALDIARFRPNIVISGVDAHEEDFASQLTIGAAEIRLVKPCVRCNVPNVNPLTAEVGREPGDTLAIYRDNKAAGGITFGVNGVVASGAGSILRVGDRVEMPLAF